MLLADLPLVLIEWIDSTQPAPQWQWIANIARVAAIKCVTVGFLITDDESVKVIAQNVGDVHGADRQVSGVITIPTRAVTRVTRLRSPCVECVVANRDSSSRRSPKLSAISAGRARSPSRD